MTTTGHSSESSSLTELTVFLCSLSVTLLLLLLLRRRFNKSPTVNPNRLPLPPCLPSLPVVGSLPFMFSLSELQDRNFPLLSALAKLCTRKTKDLGCVFSFYMMSRYTVVINGKKNIQEACMKAAFADRARSVIEKLYTNPDAHGFMESTFDTNLVQRRRKVLSILRDLGYGKRAVEYRIQCQLQKFVKSVASYEGQSIDPKHDLYQCAVGVVLGFLFGRQFDGEDPLLKHIHVYVTALNDHSGNLEVCPALRFLPNVRSSIKQLMHDSDKLFQLHDKEIDECLSSGREDSFVYQFVQSKGPQSARSEELRYILRDIYTAGSDTTVTTLRWLLLMLTNFPGTQEKLQQQIDDVFGDQPRMPSLDDIVRLPYVEAAIQETMRLEILTPINSRQTLEDTEVCGYFLPKGTFVLTNFFGAHREPDEWENPAEFRPERFIDANGKLVNKDKIFPFSVGKRSCLGEQLARQQLFLTTTAILRFFDLRPPEGQARVDAGHAPGFLNEPGEFRIRLLPRRNVELLL